MSAKKITLLVVLIAVAAIAALLTLMFLETLNKTDSGPKALEPDAMHQPSTN